MTAATTSSNNEFITQGEKLETVKAKVRVFVSNISSPPLRGDIKDIGFRIFVVMHEGEMHVLNKNLKCIFTCNKETSKYKPLV